MWLQSQRKTAKKIDHITDIWNNHGYNAADATHLALEGKLNLLPLRSTAGVDQEYEHPPGQDKRQQTSPDNRMQLCDSQKEKKNVFQYTQEVAAVSQWLAHSPIVQGS